MAKKQQSKTIAPAGEKKAKKKRKSLKSARSQGERRAILDAIVDNALDWALDCAVKREAPGSGASTAMAEWAWCRLEAMDARGGSATDADTFSGFEFEIPTFRPDA